MANQQRFWFSLHGWITLPVWLLFAFICLTGTICVVSHEITWLANPAARANNPEGLPKKSTAEIVAAAQAALPGAIATNVMVFEPYLVTVVSLSTKDRPAAIAYVNPYTAKVQELFDGMTFVGFMRSLHGWLLFPWQHRYSIGYYLVSALSLFLICATITGIVVYKRFWRSYSQPRLRFKDGLRKGAGDLHRLVGAWSIWFLLLIGITGLWYLAQALMWHNDIEIDQETVPLKLAQLPQASSAPATISIGEATAIAEKQFSNFSPSWISSPEHNKGYFEIAGKGDRFLFDEYSYRIVINPWSGEVVKTESPEEMNLVQSIAHIADPLHYGKFGGLVTKLIWFVFGSLITTMSISGFIIWLKRTTSDRSKYPPRWVFLLNGFILLLPGWFLYSSLNPQFPTSWGEAKVDNLTVSASPLDNSEPYAEGAGYQKDFAFNFCTDCASQAKLAYAAIGESAPDIADKELEGILHGHGDMLHAHVPAPKTISSSDKLWVTLQLWDGTIKELSWTIPQERLN